MFLDFFLDLKKVKIPVSLNEYFNFLEALKQGLSLFDLNSFYYLARSSLIKDEKLIDRFDLVFSKYFNGLDDIQLDDVLKHLKVPKQWIDKLIERNFTKDEIKNIKSLGGLDKLMEELKKRIEEQKKRHQGGSKWIGTSGTSPFGAYGYNPEGFRIGQNERGQGKAVKVWDKREFRDFDDKKEIDTRGMQVALKKLRQWSRIGFSEELDINDTISYTAKNGFLDVKTKPEKENSIKILLFLDVGGSMDEHVYKVESLFSAAKSSFKHLKHFYFHNCLYEGVWKNNSRRWSEQFETFEILRTYGEDYKCIFVGDASMSPYEIMIPGGGNEHYNEEAGHVWLERVTNKWSSHLWINPTPQKYWSYSHTTQIIKQIFDNKMVPLTIEGLVEGTKILSRKY